MILEGIRVDRGELIIVGGNLPSPSEMEYRMAAVAATDQMTNNIYTNRPYKPPSSASIHTLPSSRIDRRSSSGSEEREADSNMMLSGRYTSRAVEV